jgi:hypothetical protein
MYRILLATVCFALAGSAPADEPAQSEPAPAIAQGRDALTEAKPNWYDRQTDDARRIELENSTPPPSSTSPNWNLNFNWLSYLIWMLMAIVLGVLAFLLIRAFIEKERRLTTRHGAAVDITGTQADRVEHLPVPVRRPAGDLLSEARYHYEQGNYREAIIYLYSHELVELDKQQVIHLARGKTNRQYLRELKSRKPLRELLEQTMVTFEDAFFGRLEIGRERFEACWHRLTDFNALLPGAAT